MSMSSITVCALHQMRVPAFRLTRYTGYGAVTMGNSPALFPDRSGRRDGPVKDVEFRPVSLRSHLEKAKQAVKQVIV